MVVEETFENWILTRFRAAQDSSDATYNEDLTHVTKFEVGELTVDNIGEYIKRPPAVVFNVGEDNRATSPIGSKNDAQMMVFVMHVYLLVTNRFSRKAKADTARPILRALRNTLRGLRYTPEDGATEGMARVMYLDQEKQGHVGGIALYMQRYEVHSQDFNDNRRSI